MLVDQVMNIILLCLYLFCENHFILFVSVLWILFYFACTCSVLLLFCFHVVSGQRWATTTFDSAVAVPSLSKHPDDRLVIQPVLMLLYNLPQTNCFWAYVCMDAKGLW